MKKWLTFSFIIGMTCGEYTTEFFTSGGPGYVANPEASGDILCNYCQYADGNQYLDTLDWSMANRYFILLHIYIRNSVFSCFLGGGILVF